MQNIYPFDFAVRSEWGLREWTSATARYRQSLIEY